jgi:hypothetical protein
MVVKNPDGIEKQIPRGKQKTKEKKMESELSSPLFRIPFFPFPFSNGLCSLC